MHNDVLKILYRVKKILRAKKYWTQNAHARGKTGREVKLHSQRAVSFCLQAAVHKAFHEIGYESLSGAERDVLRARVQRALVQHIPSRHFARSLMIYNDHPKVTYKKVVDLLVKAIKKEKKHVILNSASLDAR